MKDKQLSLKQMVDIVKHEGHELVMVGGHIDYVWFLPLIHKMGYDIVFDCQSLDAEYYIKK